MHQYVYANSNISQHELTVHDTSRELMVLDNILTLVGAAGPRNKHRILGNMKDYKHIAMLTEWKCPSFKSRWRAISYAVDE